VVKKISTHSLRHRYATHLIEPGVDLLEVQKILGHRSLLTTSKYTHLTSHTDNNAKRLINDLMKGFCIDWIDCRDAGGRATHGAVAEKVK